MPLQSHINTFNKGMNKDYNILLQPDGTYRHCVNCNLISQDGNNYVIKDCLGNVMTFVINPRYGVDETEIDVLPMPIGFISFPDKLIVFSTNDETGSGGYGEIGIINYLPYGEGVSPTIVSGNYHDGYTPLYHHASLLFTKQQQIEGFAFQENEITQRIYWTDDFNEPRVMDIGDPVYTSYYPTGSLIVGTQYMVLEGIITHNGVDYGPSNTLSNIFTAVNANYTSVTGTSPTPKVIKYVAYQLLSFTPSRSVGNFNFSGYGSGSLYCGNKMYFYRLISPSQGIQTSWSYGSFPVPVRLGVNNDYFKDIGGGTTTTLVNSGHSVQFRITNIDTIFERIQIAVAEFDQLLEVPRVTNIILDEVITNSTMDFEHSSNINIGTLTLSDLTLFPASILTCKTMTTNKNYALIANVRERSEFVFDKSSVTVEQINYPIPAHRDNDWAAGPSCSNVMTYVPLDYDPFNNPSGANAIQPWSHWVVTDVTGGPVVYNAVNYGIGEVILGVAGVYTVTIPAGSQIRPCTYRKKYTKTAGGDVIDTSVLGSGYWDYKDPTVATNIKGLWIGEKYRYAVVAYDKKGNPFYARHIADVDTTFADGLPYLGDALTFSQTDNDGDVLYIIQRGIRFSGITFTPEVAAQMSGFSIMRAERDARIMTQGLLMQSSGSNLVLAPYTTVQPACCHLLSKDNALASAPGIYSYICPDLLADYPVNNFPEGKTIKNTFIEEAFWVDPRDQSQNQIAGAGFLKSVGAVTNEFETKYFDALGPDSTPRKFTISSEFMCNENTDLNSFANPAVYFQNKTDTGNAVAIDTQCNTLVANTTSTLPMDSVAAGGYRAVVELENDTMLDYGSASRLYSDLNSGRTKLIANVVINNNGQYGGNSESALAATTYISTGHFQHFDSTVLADVLDVNGNYTFNGVDVWGGDAFNSLIDYAYGLFNEDAIIPSSSAPASSYSWGIKFPCQCNSNYALRTGVPSRKIAPDFMHSNPSPGNGIYFKLSSIAQLEGFQYNQAYSSEGNFVAYPALPVNYSLSNTFPYRIRFAGEKITGELINSFRTFLINDYKDTDGHGGEINNLRTKDGRTVVWQNAAIDTVPILERQVVSGQDGAETAIGTGGVVDRFDPVTSYFGNQHQWGLTATEYGWIWFDMRRKAVVTLSFDSGVQEISKAEGLNGFFNEAFLEVIGNTSPITNNLLNDPLFGKYSDMPLMGVGVCGVYDPKLKMSYLTFKFIQRDASTAYNKDFTIGYSHSTKQFVGFYDSTPGISWNHNQIVLSANNPKNKLTYFAAGMPTTRFFTGDVVPYNNAEYICIATVLITSYPGAGDKVPDYPGSTYWAKINQTNELWVSNQPKLLGQAVAPDYLYNSVFGQVINNELEFIVNPKSDNPFSVLNIEQEGNNVNFTDLVTYAENQTASDTSISATSRFYKAIYNKICSNLPFSSKGRITNSYLSIRWIKKNWSSDPRVVSTSVKILRYVTSFFESKR